MLLRTQGLKLEIVFSGYTDQDLSLIHIFTYRYMNGYTWEQIAVCMHYTYQWVHRLHGQALVEFEKVMQGDKS